MRMATAMTVVLLMAGTTLEGSSLFKDGKTAPEVVVNEKGEEVTSRGTPTVSSASLISVKKPKTKKFKVHDIITIIVREESRSKSEADASTSKEASLTAELKEWIQLKHMGRDDARDLKLIPDAGIAATTPSIDVSAKGEFEGEGDVERKDSFLTKIAATVVDVKPNGNLVLEAKRFIQTDDEKISMSLTGTVRPADVAVDNSVSSTNVADLAVTKTTSGVARDGQKRGWLVRLLQAISPF